MNKKQLRQIVGADHVRPAEPNDAVADVAPSLVVEPGSEPELAAVLRYADGEGLAVTPRGGGTKLQWGNPPARADLVLSLARLNQIVEHAWADLTVTVEAGCTVAQLQQVLGPHGQRLALDPLWPERATIGGILSTNDSGALRLRYGGLRDLVIGATLALADGILAASGGKVVKNVAGYDLPKLATGALGTLGVITRATFRLHPIPAFTHTISIGCATVAEAQTLLLTILDSQLAPSAVQLRLAAEAEPQIDVLFEGTEAGVAAQSGGLRDLVQKSPVPDGSDTVWEARQELWPDPPVGTTTTPLSVAKLTMLPSDLASTMEALDRIARSATVGWRAVVQATGIGWLRLEGSQENLATVAQQLRTDLEASGGSLVLLAQPLGATRLDAWGNAGDALPLMRALKQQLDPHATLNPGRFVGGI
jgi:glycolate oxidase FAD binding subunit